jgi:hypothetical protein
MTSSDTEGTKKSLVKKISIEYGWFEDRLKSGVEIPIHDIRTRNNSTSGITFGIPATPPTDIIMRRRRECLSMTGTTVGFSSSRKAIDSSRGSAI